MAGRVLKRIARENVNVSLSLPFNREFAPQSATQSVEKSDSVTPPLGSVFKDVAYAVIIVMRCLL